MSKARVPTSSRHISADRWRIIEPLLDAAMELSGDERRQFLIGACSGDAELLEEIEGLLDGCETPDSALDSLGAETFANLLADDDARSLQLPEVVADRYRLKRELGRGGMAIVYLADDLKHEREVAIKFIRPGIFAAADLERFRAEIRVTANLRHPNIVPLYDSGETNGSAYFVMPFFDGESLRERLERERPLPVKVAARIGVKILQALEYSHSLGVLHRDVKPANVLLPGEQAILADFGIARDTRPASPELTQTGTVVGTPAYMSPEQSAGRRDVGPPSDLYSVACVLYEMLTGQAPPNASTRLAVAEHAVEIVRPMRELNPSVSMGLERCVMRGLELDASARYGSAAEMRRDVERGAREMGVDERASLSLADSSRAAILGSEQHQGAIARAREWGKRRPLTRGAIAFVAVAVAVSAGMIWRSVTSPTLDERRIALFGLTPSTVTVADSIAAADISRALGAALNSTGYVLPIDAPSADSTAPRDQGAKANAARRVRAAYYLEGAVQRSDSLRLLLTLYDVKRNVRQVRTVSLGVTTDAWTSGLLGANAILPILIPVGRAMELSSLGKRPPAAVAHFLQGESEYRSARFNAALEHFRQALGVDSSFALAALRGAQSASWALKRGEALRLAALAMRDGTALSRPMALLGAGLAAYLHADADSAVRALKAAIVLNPDWPDAWMALGEVYAHLLPRESPLDSLSFAAFSRVHELDSTFAPVAYHLIEGSVRRSEVARADSLLRLFHLARADSLEARAAALMVQCVRDSSAATRDWRGYATQQRATLVEAGRALTVGGLRQPQCAESIWRAAWAGDTSANRWGALFALQSVLVARGNLLGADSVLQADTIVGATLRDWIYLLDVAGGARGVMLGRAEAAAKALREFFSATPRSMGNVALWHLALWETYAGERASLVRIRDTLEARARGDTTHDATLINLAQSVAARARLVNGDTAGAIAMLSALTPRRDRQLILWWAWDALAADRLLLAELHLARHDYGPARNVAREFDAPGSMTFTPFLVRSLEIRGAAADSLGDQAVARGAKERLKALASGVGG